MILIDRLVRLVGAEASENLDVRSFSSLDKWSNVVLLGDPGAGKSHLFRDFAARDRALMLVARSFLNLGSQTFADSSVLYIDALDERRTGRGDQNTIDEIVRKLCEVRPKKVRIACRAADWLGATDLAAFDTYFQQAGGSVVARLEQLSHEERLAVLSLHSVPNGAEFMAKAAERGLDDLLGNPQNLTMLAEVVVKKGNWPSTRSELYKDAVALLLNEHSSAQRLRPGGKFSASELLLPAGELCAMRLVSDIAGISFGESDLAEDIPSYRSISSGDHEKALAALNRRVFVAGPVIESADYAHRTVAEYLGALWLAERIKNGLPFGRVRALMGIDGRPASELRGLHAWLALHLPDHAESLIDADPFGVLSYSDAKSLAPCLRRHLLNALARLADVDPWFRDGHWSDSAVASLSGPDMVDGYREVLTAPQAGYSLRSLVLDSMATGYAPAELSHVVQSIVVDEEASYSEREAGIEVLIQMGDIGSTTLTTLYPTLRTTEDALRLRSKVLRSGLRTGVGAEDFVSLMRDALGSAGQLTVGLVWRLSEGVSDTDVVAVLDGISDVFGNEVDAATLHHASDVLREFDALLGRALMIDRDTSGSRLLKWLEFRHRVSDEYSRGGAGGVKDWLAENRSAVARMADVFVQQIADNSSPWGVLNQFRELTFFSAFDDLLLEELSAAISSNERLARRRTLYDIALVLTFQVGPQAMRLFEDLLSLAQADVDLESVRERATKSEIPEWRTVESENRRMREQQRSEARAKNLARFESEGALIRDGTHRGWLIWVARIYFSQYSDVDREATPRQRLSAELGEQATELAIEGLISLARRGEVNSAEEILQLRANGRHHPWWYALLAGLHELVSAGGDILNYSAEFLQAALMIECSHQTFVQRNNVMSPHISPWRTTLFEARPDLVVTAYASVARLDLSRGSEHIDGLHTLLDDPALKAQRSALVLSLLGEFPSAPYFSLRKLLNAGLSECHGDEIATLARVALETSDCNVDVRMVWIAAGLLVAPVEFASVCDKLDRESKKLLVWEFRDLAAAWVRRPFVEAKVATDIVSRVLRLALEHFPRTAHPKGGWSGDRNDCDATDYALNLIRSLSADPSSEAESALQGILHEPFSADYSGDIRHALAQQRAKLIDFQFRQANWAGAVATLANGRPSGIADLHALVQSHLEDLGIQIGAANIDMFKRFWNEDKYGRIVNPKNEESCRDYLVERLRAQMGGHEVIIEPEGHMAADKRVDIAVSLPCMKAVVELKKDSHAELWTAIQGQLERFYTRDPDARGYGIFAVLWFGRAKGGTMSVPPGATTPPKTASELKACLEALVKLERKDKIGIVVLDVSGEIEALA